MIVHLTYCIFHSLALLEHRQIIFLMRLSMIAEYTKGHATIPHENVNFSFSLRRSHEEKKNSTMMLFLVFMCRFLSIFVRV